MSTTTTTTVKKPEKSIWSDLPRRAATVSIGFPLVWMLLSNPTLALVFFMGAHALVTWEYIDLEPSDSPHHKISTTTTTATPTKSSSTSSSSSSSSSSSFGFIFIVASLLLAHVSDDKLFHLLVCCTAGVFVWMRRHHWILGMVLVTIPFRTWYVLSQDFASTISLLLVVWNCDTGALLAGRLTKKLVLSGIIPRRMPVPRWIHVISPAKSMEGFLGGILVGTWTAISWIPLLMRWFSVDTSDAFDALWQPFSNRVLLGISLSSLAIVGDLVESSIKRQSQSKDSGSLLPGQGGIFDRFDSSLLAVLFYSVVLEWMATTSIF
jgi:CDP-diglyceride synthetase